MKLPKLYRVVTITFWSLRDQLGPNLGVKHDVDTPVTRSARRVACEGGWKWQIKDLQNICEWDWTVITDQEMLDEYGSSADVEQWR